MQLLTVKLLLRLAIAASFLSAVADRFGWWPAENSVWGTWEAFIGYTALINPWVPAGAVPALAVIATGAEVILAFCLLLGLRTALAANLSGILLLVFGLSMGLSTGFKAPLDYSVFSAAAAAFALGQIKERWLELDQLLSK